MHKPYYFLYFSQLFFLSRIPWFSVYFLQGLSPNHIIPCTKPMVQIPAGFFSYGRAPRLFFLFHVLPVQVHGWSSYFGKRRPASISLWIPTLGTDIFTDIPATRTDISADISPDIPDLCIDRIVFSIIARFLSIVPWLSLYFLQGLLDVLL